MSRVKGISFSPLQAGSTGLLREATLPRMSAGGVLF